MCVPESRDNILLGVPIIGPNRKGVVSESKCQGSWSPSGLGRRSLRCRQREGSSSGQGAACTRKLFDRSLGRSAVDPKPPSCHAPVMNPQVSRWGEDGNQWESAIFFSFFCAYYLARLVTQNLPCQINISIQPQFLFLFLLQRITTLCY